MTHYGRSQYWQDRYSRNTQPFDWYQRFSSIHQYIRQSMPPTSQSLILIPGCGNSRLSQQMLEQGYHQIINIDSSVTCIKNMSEKYKERTDRIRFQCMDVRSLVFGNEMFDGVVDKALFDCMMCYENAAENVYKMVCEVYRVLKKGGVYAVLSYEPPSRRIHMLEKSQFDWKVTVQKIPKLTGNTQLRSILDEGQQANYHYLYICKKQ